MRDDPQQMTVTQRAAFETLKAIEAANNGVKLELPPPSLTDPELMALAAVVMQNAVRRRARHPQLPSPTGRHKHEKVAALAALPIRRPNLPALPGPLTQTEKLVQPRYEELRRRYQLHYQCCQTLLQQMNELCQRQERINGFSISET